MSKDLSAVCVFDTISRLAVPVLPVIKVDEVDEIIPIAETLLEGGINALEITLRTSAGLPAIELAKKRFPEALVSAATVTSVDQLTRVQDAGVDFVITPGITPKLLEAAAKLNANLLPGIASPSELMTGLEFGLNRFKLFPAAVVGGVGMLKGLGGPFPDIELCPTGGLNAGNFRDYLSLDNVFCIGGSWMLISENGKFSVEASAAAIREIQDLLNA